MVSNVHSSIREEIPEEIYNELQHIGVPSHLVGYDHLAYAIYLVLDDLKVVGYMNKVIYPKIAEVFDSSTSRVERSIRCAINRLFDKGDYEIIYEYFGNSLDTDKIKATNTHFISTVARVVRKKLLAKNSSSEK